jgi:hypothetical protein
MPGSPTDIGVQSWTATAGHGSGIGDKAAVATAKALAMTGRDILADHEFLPQMKGDFAKRTKGFVHKSLRKWMSKCPGARGVSSHLSRNRIRRFVII